MRVGDTTSPAFRPGLSVAGSSIEHMFDKSVFELPAPGSMSRAELAAHTEWWEWVIARASSNLATVVGEWTRRRVGRLDVPKPRWETDAWRDTTAEIGPLLRAGRRGAARWMHIGLALRERLPQVAGLLAAGRIPFEVAAAVCWETREIEDAETVAVIDAELAAKATRFGALSAPQLKRRIGAVIAACDPQAGERARQRRRDRFVHVSYFRDGSGLASVYARLYAHDAQALQQRTQTLAQSVCEQDPRTIDQRLADALGAVLAGHDALACACDDPACPAKTDPAARRREVTITVVTDPATLTTPRDRQLHGPCPATDNWAGTPDDGGAIGDSGPGPDASATEPSGTGVDHTADGPVSSGESADCPETAEVQPAAAGNCPPGNCPPAPQPVAVLMGGHVLPAAVIAELVDAGAKVKPLKPPGPDPEPHYRPSAALAAYIRARDLTCRFFGCQVPADQCDIDHTVPWPAGPTHPANLVCLCRVHHRLKTFHPGWQSHQHPDGVIEWTTPTGHTVTTHPGSHQLLPEATAPARHNKPPPEHR